MVTQAGVLPQSQQLGKVLILHPLLATQLTASSVPSFPSAQAQPVLAAALHLYGRGSIPIATLSRAQARPSPDPGSRIAE